jgi:hypothetical protein
MHDPLFVHQVAAKALGLLPLSLPPGPLGPRTPAPRRLFLGWRRTCRHKRAIDGQDQDGPPGLARRHLRHALSNGRGWGAHVQPPPLLPHLAGHRLDGMIAQRQARELHEQLLSRRKGDLHRQSRRSLLQIPWRAALGELQGLIQGPEALLTLRTVEVGTGQGDFADQGVHRARWRGSGRQATLTVGTRPAALVPSLRMPLCSQGFDDLARQLLAQGKHHGRQFLQAGCIIGPGGLHAIQPTVQVGMQLLAGSGLGKGLSRFLTGDYGCRGHQGLLHRGGENGSFRATLPPWSPQWSPPEAYS